MEEKVDLRLQEKRDAYSSGAGMHHHGVMGAASSGGENDVYREQCLQIMQRLNAKVGHMEQQLHAVIGELNASYERGGVRVEDDFELGPEASMRSLLRVLNMHHAQLDDVTSAAHSILESATEIQQRTQ